MDIDFPDSPCTIHNPEAANLLTDPRVLSFLSPFMDRACTVKMAHESLGVSSHTMLYWVNKFLALGLLEVGGVQERKGKPIKWYRTPGRGFVIPLPLIPNSTLEDLLLRHDEPFNAQLIGSLVKTSIDTLRHLNRWEMLVWKEDTLRIDMRSLDHEGPGFHELLLTPESPAMLFELAQLQLDFEEAKSFQKELSDLLRKYRQKKGAGQYLARVALAPLQK
ncbi:hypothetical protein [Deinococcus roseus]|uniref:Transcriptional regulator n=1 Tax=Deinococcus roseus TaxID=392414 RepID=A0ABQ2CZJ5_9DEIO|nr:hypothetical protein [Deinococcus roseus]GGJ36406.1 transcriptional regulator [Deinococcus roseus]